jgi:hypothetical protein
MYEYICIVEALLGGLVVSVLLIGPKVFGVKRRQGR